LTPLFPRFLKQGGMPGAETLGGSAKLVTLLKKQAEANRPYGAMGAATAHVLQPHGLLTVSVGARLYLACPILL
jgi:4-methyl-5(b-hydroxyethyl)-thiazole monophosphate biosynthesis